MYDLYLKYEPAHISIVRWREFSKHFFLFNKKFIYHSALLLAVCSMVIYEKGLLEFDLEQS